MNRRYSLATSGKTCHNDTTDKPFALGEEDLLKIANGIRTAGIYCRLSNDDGNVGMNDSIKTQQKYLIDYCQTHNITVFDIYIDDGYSGTRFNRSAFIRTVFKNIQTEKFDKKRTILILLSKYDIL